MEETLHFKVSTGLKDIIGKDLITNELVAIFELVKNSYDANAENIEIVINSYEDTITIKDDGHGMDYDDLKEKWLFVAYSEKKENDSEGEAIHTSKPLAGSKGIGRFSCDRLGKKLSLLSKKKLQKQINHLEIDWSKFEEDALEKFEELEVSYKSLTKNDFFKESGTVLTIENLRDVWDKKSVERVIKALQRLVNPFVDDEKVKINVRFISSASGIAEIDEDVRNTVSSVLDKKTIFLECNINPNTIELELVDKEKTIYKIKMENPSILETLFAKIYYLNPAAKNNFKRSMGVHAKDYGSIFLYKNNFRIFPYGEPYFDSFGLNLRKPQGYNRFLAHRELMGWINISDTKNHFKEVSSRDRGFISNHYTSELDRMYMELIQRPLESYVQLVKFGDSEIDDVSQNDRQTINKLINRFKKYNIIEIEKYELPEFSQPIERRFDLLDEENIPKRKRKEIERSIKQVVVETKKEISNVKKDNQIFTQKIESLQNEIFVKEKILEEENPTKQKMIFHQLGKIEKDIDGTINSLMKSMDENERAKHAKDIFRLKHTASKVASIKKQILRINFETFSKLKIELKSYMKSYLNYAVDDRINLDFVVSGDKLEKEIDIFDFGVLLDNLIQNAWERNSSFINIYFEEDNSAFHFITDTGPLEVENTEDIFKLGFTTKRNGTGMGMYMCKTICEDFEWSISVSSNKNIVDFKISF